ncbi:hypothetical protein ACPPVO_10805 [Dactylosporangium sp. McL0621]|uniref:hypothetical protein n=1 Tax=Dactylosporangium sp. McL0621 TaxID=3415678 RepID=UPI003CF5CEDE
MIIAALAAGASMGVSGTANEAVKDAYSGLKGLIRRRFDDRDAARKALDADETESGVWKARIGQDLLDSGAARDGEILATAGALLKLVEAERAPVFNTRVGTSYGPVGQNHFHGPVTFGQSPTGPTAG